MDALKQLFDNNKAWSAGIRERLPDFFQKLREQQAPKYLWIGCSDSRVPANEIVGLLPGEMFVHRNVSNLVVHTDLNCLSVIQFAVDVLKVEHIIVCGHYGCGGVRAAYENAMLGLISNWLRHLQDVAEKHREQLDKIEDLNLRLRRLCELNVIEQVGNVARTTVVIDAWKRSQKLTIHGVVYGIEDGILKDLNVSRGPESMDLP
jgi:carbonic anhydrase